MKTLNEVIKLLEQSQANDQMIGVVMNLDALDELYPKTNSDKKDDKKKGTDLNMPYSNCCSIEYECYYDSTGCGDWKSASKDYKSEETIKDQKLKKAYQYLCELIEKDGYLVYGDIYKAFNINRKDNTNNKFLCGDYEAYQIGIRKLIAKAQTSIEGLKGNSKGLKEQSDHFYELAKREMEKALKLR